MTDDEIVAAAKTFAKRHRDRIARELTDPAMFVPSDRPISVFMAGSPGAGKTEFSKELINILEEEGTRRVVRIDADELRPRFPDYTGQNSRLFQGAASLMVERLHDRVLNQRQHFILDGTLSKFEKARSNIQRSLAKQRIVVVGYIYQEPKVAWAFTQAREATEGRHIPVSSFIEQFIGARKTVEHIHSEFGKQVAIFILKKNFTTNQVDDFISVDSNVAIADYLGTEYTERTLKGIL